MTISGRTISPPDDEESLPIAEEELSPEETQPDENANMTDNNKDIINAVIFFIFYILRTLFFHNENAFASV